MALRINYSLTKYVPKYLLFSMYHLIKQGSPCRTEKKCGINNAQQPPTEKQPSHGHEIKFHRKSCPPKFH